MIQTLFGSLKEAEEPPKKGLFDRMRQAVTRTRESLEERIDDVLSLTRPIDESALEDLEMSLIASDIGVNTATEILSALRERASRKQIENGDELKELLKDQLKSILDEQARPPRQVATAPEVILMVGVNGTGKTTTIGKLSNRLKKEGASVMLCAADTFRAAAIEQLEVWGHRAGVEVIKQKSGADPSAVIFDALSAATARKVDAVIVDTAGRLHTKSNLMAELEKMKRTAAKIVPGAPHDVLLVLDATTGQNGLNQAREFWSHAGVTGIVLTKLDGTAKGGIVVAIAHELNLPIRFVGTGEQMDDLVPFDAQTYVNSLFD